MLLRALINESVRGRPASRAQSMMDCSVRHWNWRRKEERGAWGGGGEGEGEGKGGKRGEGWRQYQGKCKHGVRFKEEGQWETGSDRGVIGQRVLGGVKKVRVMGERDDGEMK